MKIGKGLAFIVSVLFFFELAGVFVVLLSSLFPGFSFAENPIVRIIFLLVFIYITKLFYRFLVNGSDDEEVEDGEVGSGSSSARKVAVVGVLGVFVVFIGLFVYMNSAILFGMDDVSSPMVFNDSNVSFKYPSNWEKVDDKNYTFLAQGADVSLAVSIVGSDGYGIDEILSGLKDEDSKDPNFKISSVNKTTVDGVDGYVIITNSTGNDGIYSKSLLFVHNDNLYTFKFETTKQLNDINDSFNLVKNSIKLKN